MKQYNVMDIPDGKSGAWEISTFEVSEDDIKIENIRAMFHPGCRLMKAGRYKRLTRNGSVIMSNTPAEIKDYRHFVRLATGAVHINGLGLGCVLADILNKPDVNMVVVVEISSDVLSLVSPYFSEDKRVEFILADAYEYKPPKGSRYDAVWHDIWDNICSDNLEGMARLHRKFGRKADYQNSWCKDLCRRYAR